MAHPLGAYYDAAHGVANAILLPHVMAFNAEATGEKFREIARAMGVARTEEMTIDRAREAAVRAVAQLASSLGTSASLSDLGASKDDIPALAAAALAAVCAAGNPREATLDDVTDLYTAAF
jgi:lactaldehyde reductase